MASPAAFGAIQTYLRDVWNVTPLVFENESATPPADESLWVQIEVYGTLYAQASIGAEDRTENLFRERGVLLLHVMMPNGTGTMDGRRAGFHLVQLLAGREIDGVVFGEASIGAGDPAVPNANFATMTVSFEWHLDHN